MDLQEIYGDDLNNGAVTNSTLDLNDLDGAAKDIHFSIHNVMPSSEVVPPRKLPSSDMMPSLCWKFKTFTIKVTIFFHKLT